MPAELRHAATRDLGERIARYTHLLACPACHEALVMHQRLACPSCARTFPVRDGTPLLLADAKSLPIDLDEHSRVKERFHRRAWRRRLLYPTLVNTQFQERGIRKFIDSFPGGARSSWTWALR